MIKVAVTTLVLGLALTLNANAQTAQLQGPAYKNAKPTEKYSGSDKLLVKGRNAKRLQGPEAKNRRPGKGDKSEYTVVRLDKLNGKNTKGLQGPAYKNYKPKANN